MSESSFTSLLFLVVFAELSVCLDKKKRYRLCFYYYFTFLLDQKSNQKLFPFDYCFFDIHESSLALPKNPKLPKNTVSGPEPFAFQAQLAERCYFVLSLFFDVFNLRAELRSLTMMPPCSFYYFLCSLLSIKNFLLSTSIFKQPQ
jgi:hypothetical protein